MDAADAARCAVMIKCSQVIGVHYDTFGFIQIDKDRARQIFSSSGIHLQLPSIGETLTL